MNRKHDISSRSSRGFTIVEMLMVVAVISILIGLSFTAVTSSMQAARLRKSESLCKLVEQGIATYYAQTGEWPVSFDSEKLTDQSDVITLNSDQVRKMVRQVIEWQRTNKQPLMDISGLYVSKNWDEKMTKNYYGMDFHSAVCGTKRNPTGIRLENMFFGYPEAKKGYFRRFKMLYSPSADAVTVKRLTDQ